LTCIGILLTVSLLSCYQYYEHSDRNGNLLHPPNDVFITYLIATSSWVEQGEVRRIYLLKLSEKSGRHQDEVVDAYETRQSGLISLRYASDFLPEDTTERLFRQFL